MLHLLVFFLIVIGVNESFAQGVNDNFLKEIHDTGPRGVGDLLKGRDGIGFDPMDELDSIKSFRVERRLDETKSAKRDYDSRMAGECSCVLADCLHFQAVRIDDTRTEAEKKADEERDDGARARTKLLCLQWFCSGGANSAEDIRSARVNGTPVRYPGGIGKRTSETICPGGKIQQDAGSGKFYKQLKALAIQLDRERGVEERLRQQRRADEKLRRKKQIEAQTAAHKAETEQRRKRAEFERSVREAKKLAACRQAWSHGRHPCGCSGLRDVPARVRGTTCGK